MVEKTVELLQGILQTSDSDYLVFVTIEILWNLLGSTQKKPVAQILVTNQSLSVLKILFEHFCINGHRQTDKQLRNEILILCNEIASLSPESLPVFIETEFVGSISLFMMHVELGIEHPDVNHLIIVSDASDTHIF